MSYKKVLLGLGLAAVIVGAAVSVNAGFAQAEDPPAFPENHAFMSHRSMRWMSAGAEGLMADEFGEAMHEAMVAAFAEALDLEPSDLEAMLEPGEQMMDIALAQGFTSEDVWEIMQVVREDARAAALDSGIEFPTFRENMPNNMLFKHDGECEMDASSPRMGSRGGSLTEGRFSAR